MHTCTNICRCALPHPVRHPSHGGFTPQAEDFKATFGGNVPMGAVNLVKELEEEEDFWEYFVLG